MLALLVVRDGLLPAGAREAVSEANGVALLIGQQCSDAVAELVGAAREVRIIECGAFAPSSWAQHLAPILSSEARVVLPASPDGRDLAPHLAFHLKRPLFAGALRVGATTLELVRWGGLGVETRTAPSSFVATLQVGVRGVDVVHDEPVVTYISLDISSVASDALTVAVLPADAASIDLAEAPRIIAGGAGVDSPETFSSLFELAALVDASVGATRVVTDRGWAEHQRQIGTTGVVVSPTLYLAFGVSGAVQHTSGIGQPEHIISVNTDAHCPMMQLADLGLVTDVNALIPALVTELRARTNPELRARTNPELRAPQQTVAP
jgi:electron transfer flavoprotein alpha subunit